MFIVVDSDFHQIFIMFIMKTVLLISVLCVTLSVSAAAVVPVEEILTKETADVSLPVVPAEGVVSEERADVSVPAVEVADVEEEETELAASAVEVADVEKEETELAASDDTADVEPAVLLKVNALRNAVPPPFVQEQASSHCPAGWHAHEKHCYLMVNLTYAWTNAEFLCQNIGASLASAHNLQENNFLKQMVWKAGFLSAWFGGYRFQGYWRWDDGTPFDYNNWYSHSSSHSYDCLYLNSQDTLGWSNDRCHLGRPFICSIKAIC
ncbi:Ladderlectin [Larimichthys crocea]|uniref:Uncharacterized protein n=1 Tax=Larimichthys crocea TaxID=215358 RepID=A0ACD3R404_LARCR|nr:Ladderlectin [Larimichthys crocea]